MGVPTNFDATATYVEGSKVTSMTWTNNGEYTSVKVYQRQGDPVATPYLFLTDTDNHRIQKRSATDLSYDSRIGSQGSGYDQFQVPTGICAYGEFIYVADYANHRIVKRRADNLNYVAQVGSFGSGNNQFQYPYGICTDGTHLYISDVDNHRIVKRLCSDGTYVAQIGSKGTGDDQFDNPHGICYWYDPNLEIGYIFICDRDNHRIKKHKASDLSYAAKIGSLGTGDDQFNKPYGIYADATTGWLFVADRNNHRIHKRSADNLAANQILGTQGSGNDQFSYPRGITGDGTNIYICDTLNHRIQKRLISDMSYVSKIGSQGTGDDQFNSPSEISYMTINEQPWVLIETLGGSAESTTQSDPGADNTRLYYRVYGTPDGYSNDDSVAYWADTIANTVTTSSIVLSSQSLGTAFKYYLGSDDGKVYEYDSTYRGDAGSAISSYYKTKKLDFFDQYPHFANYLKTVSSVTLTYVDKGTHNVAIQISMDGGATWFSSSTKSLGTGSGTTKESVFHFWKTGKYFNFRIDHGSTAATFQWIGMEVEFAPDAKWFEVS